MHGPLDVLVTYVPRERTADVLEALFGVGAGRVGNYDRCAFVSSGTGQFRPLPGANPSVGQLHQLENVPEDRVEVTYPRALRRSVLAALRAAHPYEEPAFHVIENAAT